MEASSKTANNRQTTIEVLGINFKVFNAAPQRRKAMARVTPSAVEESTSRTRMTWRPASWRPWLGNKFNITRRIKA